MNKYLQAYVVDKFGTKVLIAVPMLINDSGLPDVPLLVECNGWYGYIQDTNPLTYKAVGPPVKVKKIKSL